MNFSDAKLQDSSVIGNIAASNAVWVKTFGDRRKKGNIKKVSSLRQIAPINYNEGSNEEEEEEDYDIEEEEVTSDQYNTEFPTFSSYAKKKSTTPKSHSPPQLSPSSLRKPTTNKSIKSETVTKTQKKRKTLDLEESESDNSILMVEKLPKKSDEMELIKQQLRMTQEQYSQMNNLILTLTTQLASKPAAKPEPETTSPKKEIAPKGDGSHKMDSSLKEDTSKDTDEDEVDM